MGYNHRRDAKKFQINAEVLGGLTTSDADGAYSGLPVQSAVGNTDSNVALADTFGANRATGSIIQALNYCYDVGNLTAGNGIIIADPAGETDGIIAIQSASFSGLTYLSSSDNAFIMKLGTLADAAIVVSDKVTFTDVSAGGTLRNTTVANLVDGGDGTGFVGGGFNGLTGSSGQLAVNLNGLLGTATAAVASDTIAFIDASDSNASKKITIANFVDAGDGTGLVGGGFNGLTGSSGQLAVNLNGLEAAAVDEANDSIAFIDANDSNGSRKESIADLAEEFAGAATTGVGASSGQLSIGGANQATFQKGTLRIKGTDEDDATKYYSVTVSGSVLVLLETAS